MTTPDASPPAEQAPTHGQTTHCTACSTAIVWYYDDPDTGTPYGHWFDTEDRDLCPATDENANDPGHTPADFHTHPTPRTTPEDHLAVELRDGSPALHTHTPEDEFVTLTVVVRRGGEQGDPCEELLADHPDVQFVGHQDGVTPAALALGADPRSWP